MAYKRAGWHSGLTYQQVCPYCRTVVRYNDYSLGFRAWYPDGFVYCPKCNKPLRHHEGHAINEDGSPYYTTPVTPYGQPIQQVGQAVQQPMQQPVQQPVEQPVQQETQVEKGECPNCGKAFDKGVDHFCSGCGTKLD